MMNTLPPEASVVIASVVGAPFIDDCLASVLAQRCGPEFEVIVVDCRGAENVARLVGRFPEARFIRCARRETVPYLRRLGAEQARGEIVAIIEEHCLAKEHCLPTGAARARLWWKCNNR
jgi:glycosyltransferase involved in cell wall biosynthesis